MIRLQIGDCGLQIGGGVKLRMIRSDEIIELINNVWAVVIPAEAGIS